MVVFEKFRHQKFLFKLFVEVERLKQWKHTEDHLAKAKAQDDKTTRKAAKDQSICLLMHTLSSPLIFASFTNKFDLQQLS